MASMSTPINQLPNVSNEIIQQNSSQLDDPTIADVISEMEREVQSQPQQRQPPPQQYAPQMQMPPPQQMQPPLQMQMQYPQINHSQHVQHMQGQGQGQGQYPQSQYGGPQYHQRGHAPNYFAQWVDVSHAQRAILGAIVAAILFYPFETGAIYEKIPFFTNAHQYDRLIRTIVLAIVLYVLLLKLKI
jgi:hypothetical protein